MASGALESVRFIQTIKSANISLRDISLAPTYLAIIHTACPRTLRYFPPTPIWHVVHLSITTTVAPVSMWLKHALAKITKVLQAEKNQRTDPLMRLFPIR